MKFLLEVKVSDDKVEKTGYTKDMIADWSLKVLKEYWYDEGIVFNKEDDSETVINLYK